MSDEISEIKDEEQEKLAQEMGEEESRPARSEWIVGAVLIIAGLAFLAGNIFSFSFITNWWAIFIFIPALYSLSQAWGVYQANGRLTERARNNLIGGLLIGAVAVIFLFGLNFGNWWPIFLIIIGVGALIKARG